MLVLIDESGDCGFKFKQGSSSFFTCVAVVFSDVLSIDACDRGIDDIRRRLKEPSNFEFHFSHCPNSIRSTFLAGVAPERFNYYGFVIDKRKLRADNFNDPQKFYEFAVGIVCENAKKLFNNSKVTIDKNGDRRFRARLEKSLKSQMVDADGKCLLKKVGMEESHSNNLIQLADMICGAVARSYTASDDGYRKLVKER